MPSGEALVLPVHLLDLDAMKLEDAQGVDATLSAHWMLDGGPDDEEVVEWISRQEAGDGGSSSPNEGTSVFGEAPSADEDARKRIQEHLRMVRRVRRVRMEIAWAILLELPPTIMGASRNCVRFLEHVQRMNVHFQKAVTLTKQLVSLGLYYPSNRSRLELTLLQEVLWRVTGPFQILESFPQMPWEGQVICSTIRESLHPASRGLLPKGPWRIDSNSSLLTGLLEGMHSRILRDASRDGLPPWHRLLELAIAMVSEVGFSACVFSTDCAPEDLRKLWKDLESACRTLCVEEWAYAGLALSAIPSLVGLDFND